MKMMKYGFLTMFALVVLGSCNTNKETSANDQMIEQAFFKERDNFFNAISTPDETAASIRRLGAEFNPSLMHDPLLWGMYTTSKEKAAAALGIYISDLNYSVAFGQTEYTTALFDAVHNLSLKVGVEKQILEFLLTRYKNNIEQNDSVKHTLNQMYARAMQTVKGTENEIMIGITIGTHQIEDLHLMMGIIKTYPKDILPDDVRLEVLVPLFQTVLNERPTIETVNEFIKAVIKYSPPVSDNSHQEYYLNAFEDLVETYRRLTVEEKIRENRGMELVSDAVVLELDSKVEAIRSKVISPE